MKCSQCGKPAIVGTIDGDMHTYWCAECGVSEAIGPLMFTIKVEG